MPSRSRQKLRAMLRDDVAHAVVAAVAAAELEPRVPGGKSSSS